MRRAGIVFSALLAAGPAALAQAPLPPPGRAPPASTMPVAQRRHRPGPASPPDRVGEEGRRRQQLLRRLRVREEEHDHSSSRDTTYAGTLMCMKPNLARMRIDNKADKTDYQAYIADGKAVYQYDGREKDRQPVRHPARRQEQRRRQPAHGVHVRVDDGRGREGPLRPETGEGRRPLHAHQDHVEARPRQAGVRHHAAGAVRRRSWPTAGGTTCRPSWS